MGLLVVVENSASLCCSRVSARGRNYEKPGPGRTCSEDREAAVYLGFLASEVGVWGY